MQFHRSFAVFHRAQCWQEHEFCDMNAKCIIILLYDTIISYISTLRIQGGYSTSRPRGGGGVPPRPLFRTAKKKLMTFFLGHPSKTFFFGPKCLKNYSMTLFAGRPLRGEMNRELLPPPPPLPVKMYESNDCGSSWLATQRITRASDHNACK